MKRMSKRLSCFLVIAFSLLVIAGSSYAQEEEIRIIVRGDDMGMSHEANMAFLKAFEEGVLTCGAVQVPAPWFEEAAELARKNPHWCVGVHLCLIGEWRGYRWRPVLPWDKVPSLVDEDGFLYRYPAELGEHNPDPAEIEAELRAQIELAKKKGIDIGYIDVHYGGIPREIVQKLGKEYNVPISRGMGEKSFPHVYMVPVDEKIETATKNLEEAEPGLWMWMCHIGIDSPAQDALIHTMPEHIFPGEGVGKHRAAELATLTSIQVKSMILKKGIKLVSYRDLWEEQNKK